MKAFIDMASENNGTNGDGDDEAVWALLCLSNLETLEGMLESLLGRAEEAAMRIVKSSIYSLEAYLAEREGTAKTHELLLRATRQFFQQNTTRTSAHLRKDFGCP